MGKHIIIQFLWSSVWFNPFVFLLEEILGCSGRVVACSEVLIKIIMNYCYVNTVSIV